MRRTKLSQVKDNLSYKTIKENSRQMNTKITKNISERPIN